MKRAEKSLSGKRLPDDGDDDEWTEWKGEFSRGRPEEYIVSIVLPFNIDKEILATCTVIFPWLKEIPSQNTGFSGPTFTRKSGLLMEEL